MLKESCWEEYSARRKNLGEGGVNFLLLNTVVFGRFKGGAFVP